MNRDTGPIVSSAHLVSEKSAELSEFEFGLMIASEAFNRWVVRCMGAAGVRDLSTLDVVVLHSVNHRGREKRLNYICFVLNIEDAHLVTYALKKLGRLGLVERSRRGKEVVFATTAAGRDMCSRYRKVRDACLIEALSALGTIDNREIGSVCIRALLVSEKLLTVCRENAIVAPPGCGGAHMASGKRARCGTGRIEQSIISLGANDHGQEATRLGFAWQHAAAGRA